MKRVIAIILIIKYILVSLLFPVNGDFLSFIVNAPQLIVELVLLYTLNRDVICRVLVLFNVVNVNFIPYISIRSMVNEMFKLKQGNPGFAEASPFLFAMLITLVLVILMAYKIKNYDNSKSTDVQGFIEYLRNIIYRSIKKDIFVVVFSVVTFSASVITKALYYADPYAGDNIEYLLFYSYIDYTVLLLELFLCLTCSRKTLYTMSFFLNIIFCYFSYILIDEKLLSLYYMKNYVLISYGLKAVFIGYLFWRMVPAFHNHNTRSA